MRDALFLQRTPVLLTDLVYLPLIGVTTALLGLLACGLFIVLKKHVGVSAPHAAWAAVGVFLLRVLAVRFNWNTRSVLRESDTGEPNG